MSEFLIIGDVAGQYDALMRLLKKCPDYLPISVGDMIDRGPDSKKVLEFFMQHGKAVLGNHEHMMLDFGKFDCYSFTTWVADNGGYDTLANFTDNVRGKSFAELRTAIPSEILEWVSGLPLYLEYGDVFISHAPLNPEYTLEEVCAFVNYPAYHHLAEYSIIWNRKMPKPIKDKYQIFGHNGYHYFLTEGDDANLEDFEYAVCIDASRQNQMVAMVWPTKETILADL